MITEFATIPAKNARFHWKSLPQRTGASPMVYVGHVEEKFINPDRPGSPIGCDAWFGAGDGEWSKLSDSERSTQLPILALNLIVYAACDPDEVIRQFCKIEEFYERGNSDLWIRKTINKAVTGEFSIWWPTEV
jgi:hypothetical protein